LIRNVIVEHYVPPIGCNKHYWTAEVSELNCPDREAALFVSMPGGNDTAGLLLITNEAQRR